MKALILYTNTDAGHVSAGKSLYHELRNLDIETIELDTLNFAGKSTSKKWNKFRLLFHFSQEFIDNGINKNKLYSFGLPVHSKISKYVDKIKAKKELNLNPNMNHIKLINIKF